ARPDVAGKVIVKHLINGVNRGCSSARAFGLRIAPVGNVAGGALGETASLVRCNGPVNPERKPALFASSIAIAKSITDDTTRQSPGDETTDLTVGDDVAGREGVNDALADSRLHIPLLLWTDTPTQAWIHSRLRPGLNRH